MIAETLKIGRALVQKPKVDFPQVSGGLPVIGHTVEFGTDAIGLLKRARAELGDVAGFRLFHKQFALLTGAAANEAFFRAPDEQLSTQEAYKMMKPVFGADVVYDAAPGKMAEQMAMLLPALQDKRMRTYAQIIGDEVTQSMSDWGDSGTLDLVAYCAKLTNFTSAHCLLGPEFRNELTVEFSQVYHDLDKGIHPIGYLNAYLPIPAFKRRDIARVRLQEMIGEIVQRRRASGFQGEDFLQTLMDARYKSGEPLSEHEITGLLLAAMFAGHHTSSVTTAWTLIELLRNPFYFMRVLQELEQMFAKHGEISYLSLRDAPLIEYAIKETLRLHPPLFMLLRSVVYPFEYGGYHFEKGTQLVVSPTVSHHIPEVFKDPTRFDPDRFGPDRKEDKNKFNFISFGGGRHKCLGNAFALLQVKTIFAKLLKSYEFALGDDPIEGDFTGVVSGPKGPFHVHYKKR
jgi:sterol 14-demethylase